MARIYSWDQDWAPGEFPAMLAIGDSWFWYPGNNLLEALHRHPRLFPDYANLVRLGENGALLADYVDVPGRPGKFAGQLARQFRPGFADAFSFLLLSGAGNDAVDYRLGLRPDCRHAQDAEQCIDPDGMHRLMSRITLSLSMLLHEAMWSWGGARSPRVLMHTYDYAVPDGRGFALAGLTLGGPWLAPAMDVCRVPADAALRQQVVVRLIDELHQALARYHDPARGIWVIDSRGVLDSGPDYRQDWANELHPTASGFDAIVDQRWIPVLAEIGIARA